MCMLYFVIILNSLTFLVFGSDSLDQLEIKSGVVCWNSGMSLCIIMTHSVTLKDRVAIFKVMLTVMGSCNQIIDVST